VQVPVAESLSGYLRFLAAPRLLPVVEPGGVHLRPDHRPPWPSLETLLNLESGRQGSIRGGVRHPRAGNCWPKGIGNVLAGLVGGLPITSVIARSSVNINAGGRTKFAAVVHGVLLLVSVMLLPAVAEHDPAVLPGGDPAGHRGQAGPARRSSSRCGARGPTSSSLSRSRLVSIVLTDLLIGVLIGAGGEHRLHPQQQRAAPDPPHRGKSTWAARWSTSSWPIRSASSNRAALARALDEVPRRRVTSCSTHGAPTTSTPDLLELIRDFEDRTAPARGVAVSLLGFPEQVSDPRPDPVRALLHPRAPERTHPRSRCCRS